MGVHIGANWRIRLRAVRGGDAALPQIASEYSLNVFAARRCASYMHSAVCAVARCYVETPELIELGLGAEAALACPTSLWAFKLYIYPVASVHVMFCASVHSGE